jgi:hypothetical protein
MKRHWDTNPLPPPDGSDDKGPDPVSAFLLLAFLVVAPLIYFAPQLRVIEVWLVTAYGAVEDWLNPIRDWFLGLMG